jgi:hypothetical protein
MKNIDNTMKMPGEETNYTVISNDGRYTVSARETPEGTTFHRFPESGTLDTWHYNGECEPNPYAGSIDLKLVDSAKLNINPLRPQLSEDHGKMPISEPSTESRSENKIGFKFNPFKDSENVELEDRSFGVGISIKF